MAPHRASRDRNRPDDLVAGRPRGDRQPSQAATPKGTVIVS
jgi:hypothetical protein